MFFSAIPLVPADCMKFERTERELQEFFLFTTVSPVSVADIQAAKLNTFLAPAKRWRLMPFTYVKYLIWKGGLDARLHEVKMGRYKTVLRCWTEFFESDINLRTCTPQQLEALYGIGLKTSRFFVCYSRPSERYAILDTHTLKFLRERGYDAPGGTPHSKKRYYQLEEAFIQEADAAGKTPVELDQEVWRKYQVKVNGLAIR